LTRDRNHHLTHYWEKSYIACKQKSERERRSSSEEQLLDLFAKKKGGKTVREKKRKFFRHTRQPDVTKGGGSGCLLAGPRERKKDRGGEGRRGACCRRNSRDLVNKKCKKEFYHQREICNFFQDRGLTNRSALLWCREGVVVGTKGEGKAGRKSRGCVRKGHGRENTALLS